jgi:hypothetical protein
LCDESEYGPGVAVQGLPPFARCIPVPSRSSVVTVVGLPGNESASGPSIKMAKPTILLLFPPVQPLHEYVPETLSWPVIGSYVAVIDAGTPASANTIVRMRATAAIEPRTKAAFRRKEVRNT